MSTIRRTERFGMALSEPERAGLRHLAQLEGVAEADVMRKLLRTAISQLPVESRQAIDWPTKERISYAQSLAL